MAFYILCVFSALFIACQANRYRVIVKTGGGKYAGTDANVQITLYDGSAICGPKYLDTPKNDFEPHARDVFTVRCPSLRGGLVKIKIGHDNTGRGPGWYIDEVDVEDIASRQFYTFPCHKWLATDEGDGAISRVLTQLNGYKVRVYTGTKANSGTDANVRITLFGSSEDCGPKKIDDPANNFENGKVDQFVIWCPSLGELKRIHIAHDNTGNKPGWYLKKIVVIDMATRSVYTFPCKKWLARDKGNHATWRDLTRVRGFRSHHG